jgi:uncharacterized protein (TIGR00730 family)
VEEKRNKIKSLAIFCASSDGLDTTIFREAYEVGVFLALNNIDLIFGGSKLGLMGQVAKGVLENGGRAIGVIPEFLKTKEVAHTGLSDLIMTNDMHERKMKMHDLSGGFVALPGGFGTLEEFFEILTWAQLGLHHKPIGILNSNGYFDDLIEMMHNMVRKGLLREENLNLVLISETIEGLYKKMLYFKPTPVPKWMNKDQT